MSRGLSQQQIAVLELLRKKGPQVISSIGGSAYESVDALENWSHSQYTAARRAVRSLEQRGLVRIFKMRWRPDERTRAWEPADDGYSDHEVRELLTVELTKRGQNRTAWDRELMSDAQLRQEAEHEQATQELMDRYAAYRE